MNKLYLVTFINQDNGKEITEYVLAKSMAEIEFEYADIINIKPLMVTTLDE